MARDVAATKSLGFGMEFVVDFFEMLVGDVGVDLGGGDVGVAEHSLDGAEIGAVHEEVSGEAVAQSVGRNVLGDAGGAGVFLDDAFNGAAGETAIIARGVGGREVFTIIEKEGSEGIGAGIKVVLDAFGGGGGDENGTVFAAFATDKEFATVEVDGVAVELDELGNA